MFVSVTALDKMIADLSNLKTELKGKRRRRRTGGTLKRLLINMVNCNVQEYWMRVVGIAVQALVRLSFLSAQTQREILIIEKLGLGGGF